MIPKLLVTAAIIIHHKKVLVTRRRKSDHGGGRWEFPGGKVGPGEPPRAALKRELIEELGLDVEVGRPYEVVYWRYPEREVLLLFFNAELTPHDQIPRALEVAEWRWADAEALKELDFLEADEGLVAQLGELLSKR